MWGTDRIVKCVATVNNKVAVVQNKLAIVRKLEL